ncbi:MAG: Methylated-DNA--protein-cysteine methyltransferase [Candidatus Heimdallarchaeota archaeon AB_125]|nr:MAG: Methylated-DNA--protein-cysteine methyltransferase [Candidatus Heimdallarchaeota archaeon AB_125]
MEEFYIANYNSPIGNLVVISNQQSILECNFQNKKKQSKEIPRILERALKQLDEYFKGERRKFDLDLSPSGTEFQEEVWKQLIEIPFGSTISYRELAVNVGNKRAVRAVGNANGKNPISIIIPCHRVIGSDGKLVGYGGGIEKKKWLLDFEQNQ